MDSITLTITNVDRLPDGGPVTYSSTGQRFEVGRETHRDWSLPDPQLFISGRHCEIAWARDGYMLNDVSRNGTFVNGSQQRVKSPYLLKDGDTLAIGTYIISVRIAPAMAQQTFSDPWGQVGNGSPVEANFPAGSNLAEDDDIWGSSPLGSSPPPMDKRAFQQPAQRPSRTPDFVESHLDLPIPQTEGQPAFRPVPHPGTRDPFETAGDQSNGRSDVFPGSRAAAPEPRPPFPENASEGYAAPERPTRGGREDRSLMAAFKEGARLPPHALVNRDPGEALHEIGATMLMISEQVAQLLRARASAKAMVRTSSRTMIGARDNNPLKFLPDPTEALEAMLSRERAGYLDGPRAFREAFNDLKTHEMATYAAMQRALARLLEDLSPDVIESKVAQSSFANRKAKAWETFVSRWEAKTEAHANGMLDVFLNYFSEAYQEISSKGK